MGLVGGVAVPLVLSGGYAAIVLSHWSSGQGGFDSLASVEQLFKSRWLLLAGWVHYLAFDLLVGAWQLRTARREGIPHLHLLPCLLATFLFGPAGYLLFQLLRAAHRSSVRSAALKPAHRAPGPWTLRRLAADSPGYTGLAVLLALAMLPLFGAFLLDERLFQGVNVWLKPLKFHAALVIYLLTLAAFARFASAELRSQPWWRWYERLVVLAVVLELIWIGGAAALGTASHYNESTPLATAVYSFMGVAAVLLTSASATLAWAIHRHPAGDLSPAVRTGLVWGLGLTLLLTLVTAQTLSGMDSHGASGTPNDAAGLWLLGWSRDGGDLRAAHFFATHAIRGLRLRPSPARPAADPTLKGPTMQIPFKLIRNVHLAASPFIGAFVYSGALRENDAFLSVIQWVVFPLVAAAGLVLWLGPRLARYRAGRTSH
jgi:hypothetical protein